MGHLNAAYLLNWSNVSTSPLGGNRNLSSLIDERVRPGVWQGSNKTSRPVRHRRNNKFIVSEWASIRVLLKKGVNPIQKSFPVPFAT
jgi:hypothetical protein